MEKFDDYDFKRLDPNDLHTVDECAYAMAELDQIIADIDAQISYDLFSSDNQHPTEWRVAAKQAIKYARISRQLAQDRRGALSREVKQTNALRMEKLFIDASMRVLSKEQVKLIWDEAHRLMGGAHGNPA